MKTKSVSNSTKSSFKLNYKRTMLIGFAFFGILLLWQVYDSWCPTFLSELFKEAFHTDNETEVQYLVGIMMAMDNLAALILLPIFGHLSDKTKTPIGKRMPYILVGTFVCATSFPFIPVLFHYHNMAGTIAMMAIVVVFSMMYRNPAVSLMPDMTPKPLRSKANGIINIMGYVGGACGTLAGVAFVLSDYLGKNSANWLAGPAHSNIWIIEIPFLLASALMLISAIVLFFTIKENKIEKEMEPEMKRGEEVTETADAVSDEAPLSKANRTMLFLILAAAFFWFMADNGIGTFMGNYTLYYLHCKTSSNLINTIIGGLGSVLGFACGGYIAAKIGRKWTAFTGLGLTGVALAIWAILTFAIPVSVPTEGYNAFPWYLFIIWGVKGFGMSLVHVNSYPMVVELCTSKKIGAYTGYYYASSMAAQTVTPVALGSMLLVLGHSDAWKFLPIYAVTCLAISFAIFAFVKNVKTSKTEIKVGLEGIGTDED